ncbi:GNAT family N-acetyltransferase [Enterococcus sp. AZ103]|uniref:GNAT family N-acetyltransferase n=1 Tax=Enterococcus sp. AZ103 TaxID=2774628 RepID=UPI003F24AFE8
MLTSPRLSYREFTDNDFDKLKEILQNPMLMLLGWQKTFDDEGDTIWLEKIQAQYRDFGSSYFLIEEKESGEFVGMIGVLPIDLFEQQQIEMAYLIKPEFQGRGYAFEAAQSAESFIFQELQAEEYIAQFVVENISSKRIAEKLGMHFWRSYDRTDQAETRKHLIYRKTVGQK